MADSKREAAPGKNAKTSRRAGLRAHGLRRHRQESWIRPFRRTRRSIASTLRLIDSCRGIINDCETYAGVRPLRAGRQLQRVAGFLAQAALRLGRSVECMHATNRCIADAPENAGGAPARMIDALERWVDAATQLAMLSNRFDDTFGRLSDYVKSGIAPLDLSELFPEEKPAPRPVTVRRPSARVLSIENNRIFCIHVRRQRSAPQTVAEAPKRIFRGRAPPLLSTCSL